MTLRVKLLLELNIGRKRKESTCVPWVRNLILNQNEKLKLEAMVIFKRQTGIINKLTIVSI